MIELNSSSTWGTRLSLLLRRNQMTGRQLAEKLDVSEMTVSKWLKGGGVSDEHLDRLCGLLFVTRTWLRWGEDFLDDSVWLEATDGEKVIRRYVNGTNRLSLATTSEAAHGYVTWMVDSEMNTWQWSGNAYRFFGLESAHYCGEPLNLQIRQRLIPEHRYRVLDLIEKVAEGKLHRGCCEFRLKHRPERSYMAIVRNVPSPAGEWRVYGMAISDGGTLGELLKFDASPKPTKPKV